MKSQYQNYAYCNQQQCGAGQQPFDEQDKNDTGRMVGRIADVLAAKGQSQGRRERRWSGRRLCKDGDCRVAEHNRGVQPIETT